MKFDNGILQQKKLTKEEAIKYCEHGVFVQCSCLNVEDIPLEANPIKITGKAKKIADGMCSKCGKHITVYASIRIEDAL